VSSSETDDGGAAAFVLDESPEGASYRVVADGATSEPVAGDGWTVAFSDEFDGDALDDAAWFHRGPDYNPDGYRACSKGSPDAVDVSDGALRLRVVRDPDRSDTCTAKTEEGKNLGQFDYRLNGHVASKSLFTYGVTAARIKFPRERGQHGSFWYQTPLALEGDAASAGAEIDVVEYFGEDGENRLASFVHYPTPDGDVKEGDWIEDADRFLASKDDDWWKQFHVFSLQWTPEEYVIRIDGQEAWRTDQGISEQQQFVVLSLLSSDYELPKLGSEDKLPQEMAVDWLRVYGG
jgi:beta-glucanase (GH16 family)